MAVVSKWIIRRQPLASKFKLTSINIFSLSKCKKNGYSFHRILHGMLLDGGVTNNLEDLKNKHVDVNSKFAIFTFCICLHALPNVGELMSIDRFYQLARKTFACTCAARDSRQRAKWAPFSNAKWLFWLPPNFFKRWKNHYFPNIFLQKRSINTIVL